MKMSTLALLVGISAAAMASPSHAANILVVLSDADHLDLKDGKVYQTGFYLNELMQPVKAFINAGDTVTFATPSGHTPAIDQSSLDKSYFGGSEQALRDSEALLDKLGVMSHSHSSVISLAQVKQRGYGHFDAVYVPGGHAPMQDLLDDPQLGSLLRDFHAHRKVTAMECHGPIALLSALADAKAFSKSMVAGTAKAQPQWIYSGYAITVFGNAEEAKAVPLLMHGGDMKFYPQTALTIAGAHVETSPEPFQPKVVVDRELITGENPASATLLAQAVLNKLHP